MSLFTKIGLFLWTLFAPEKAKAEVENIMKEFIGVMLWLLFIVFLLGISFLQVAIIWEKRFIIRSIALFYRTCYRQYPCFS